MPDRPLFGIRSPVKQGCFPSPNGIIKKFVIPCFIKMLIEVTRVLKRNQQR